MTSAFLEPEVGLRERLRSAIESLLPWYDPEREAERDRRTEAIRRRSIRTRILAERRLANYRSVQLKR